MCVCVCMCVNYNPCCKVIVLTERTSCPFAKYMRYIFSRLLTHSRYGRKKPVRYRFSIISPYFTRSLPKTQRYIRNATSRTFLP